MNNNNKAKIHDTDHTLQNNININNKIKNTTKNITTQHTTTMQNHKITIHKHINTNKHNMKTIRRVLIIIIMIKHIHNTNHINN